MFTLHKIFWIQNRIQFNNTSLVIEENSYKTKIVSVFIVYEQKIVWCDYYGIKIAIKKGMYIVAMEWHLMEKIHRVLVMIMLEML